MKDRDVEAQPGDSRQTELDYEELDRFAASRGLVLPHKADVSRSDQARRLPSSRESSNPAGSAGSSMPVRRSAGELKRPAEQARFLETSRETPREASRPIAPSRPTAHPRSRRRLENQGLTGPGLAGLGKLAQDLMRSLGGLRMPTLGTYRVGDVVTRRPLFSRPGRRGLFGLGGLTATVGIVTALIVTLPNHPSAAVQNGSIYGVRWQGPVALPVSRLDFGPYLMSFDNDLLMLGTVGKVTTLWSTADGSTWTQKSDSGAFAIDGRRFVAQGLSDDGQGGLVVIGNSLGTAPTDVIASSWHSRDGASWTPMTVDSATGQEMAAGVAARPGAAVAAGNGVAWLSTDGRVWSPQVLPGALAQGGSYTPSVVGSWDGGFVIVGLWIGSGSTRSTAWYSANGRDWAQAATSLAGFDAIGVAGLDGKIVAVGTDLGDANSGQAASWSSSDGLTWTKSTAPTDVPVAALDSVARVGTSLIACGAPNVSPTSVQQAGPTLPGSTPRPSATELLWVSEDGVNWVPITSSAAPVDNARLVAMGNRVSMIGGSSNGATANSGDLVLGPKRPPVAGSASANFALSVKAASLPMIPDVSKGYTLGPVTTTKDHFYTFATGPSGTSIFNSTSGSLWSRQIKPAGLTATGATGETLITGRPVVLAAVPDGKSGIIAAGKVTDASGDNGMIWHMTQVGKWNQVAFEDDTPPEFSSIAAGPTGFVASSDAAGGSPIMYSTDGNDWRAGAINVGSGLALSVATYHYGFVAVGSDPGHQGASTAWTSPDGRTWTMRTDWHLPPNATALVGMGYGLVVAAKTATPGSTASPTPSPTPGASPSSSASPKATPKATPKPTGAPKPTTTTWWWSPTGGSWQQSGITTSGGNWAIANNQFLVFDAPTTVNNDWTAWTSSDGRNWKHPSGNAVNFPGSKTCVVASRGNVIVIVSWQSSGVLKGYFGSFVGH